MLRVKSFKLEDADKADKFITTHTLISTKNMAPIMINNGYMVVFHEDGVHNLAKCKDEFVQMLNNTKDSVEREKHTLRTHQNTLKEMTPKGYSAKSTVHQIVGLICDEMNIEKLKDERTDHLLNIGNIKDEELRNKRYSDLSPNEQIICQTFNSISELENSVLMSTKAIAKFQKDISLLEETIKSYD